MVIFSSVTFGHFSNFHPFSCFGWGSQYHCIISGDRDVAARTQIDEVKSNMPCIMDLGNPALRRGPLLIVFVQPKTIGSIGNICDQRQMRKNKKGHGSLTHKCLAIGWLFQPGLAVGCFPIPSWNHDLTISCRDRHHAKIKQEPA